MLLKLPLPLIHKIISRNVSALRVSGDYANLKPFFDFDAKLHNREKLEQNIRRRKLNIDVNEIHSLWSTYQDLEKQKADLEGKRQENANSFRKIDRKAAGSDAILAELKKESVMLRNELKTLSDSSSGVESAFVDKFLDIPNEINDRTPVDEDQILFSHGDQQSVGDGVHHLSKSGYVEYHDPYCYFLKGDAAKLDLELPLYCRELFRSHGYSTFSNPDFIRTILADRACVDVDGLVTIIEEDVMNKLNLLHLAGSGSMLGFLGFVTKWQLYPKYLPLKLVASGKAFSTSNQSTSGDDGLYSAVQSTNAQVLCLSSSHSESMALFDETLEQMTELYKRLDRTFRIRYVAGDQLSASEELRAVYEMYSPYRKCFVPVGHLSSYSDYISKRLLTAYTIEKKLKFAHLISGSVLNATRFLAILLEEEGVLKLPTTILHNFK